MNIEYYDNMRSEIPSCVCGFKFDKQAPFAFITVEKNGIKLFACSKECIAQWLHNTKDEGHRLVQHISELKALN